MPVILQLREHPTYPFNIRPRVANQSVCSVGVGDISGCLARTWLRSAFWEILLWRGECRVQWLAGWVFCASGFGILEFGGERMLCYVTCGFFRQTG
jgi:hypothetical protein